MISTRRQFGLQIGIIPSGTSGSLEVRDDGNLVITDARLNPKIVNSRAVAKSNKTRAQILDTGNLILLEDEDVIWRSFEYPTDTFLPGFKLVFFFFLNGQR